MQLFSKRTAREKEIRRSKAERQPSWFQRLAERVAPRPVVLLLFCALAAGVLVNAGHDVLSLHPGQLLARAMTARVAFRIVDEEQTRIERVRARDNAEDYYTLDTSLLQDIKGRLANALVVARQQAGDPARLRQAAADIKIQLDDAGLDELNRLASLADASLYERALERAVAALRPADARCTPLVEVGDQTRRRTGVQVVLVDPEQALERPVSINRLRFANNLDDVAAVAEVVAEPFPTPLRTSVKNSVIEMLRATEGGGFKPLYRYDTAASARAAQQAEERVETVYRSYEAGKVLAPARDPSRDDGNSLTRDQLALLRTEHERYVELRNTNPAMLAAHRWALLARGLLAFVLTIALGGYIMVWHARTHRGPSPQAVTALTLLLLLLVGRCVYLYTPSPYLAVGAQAFAMSLLTITSRRTAPQAGGVLLALMLTLATRQGIGFLVILAAVSVVLSVALRDVRNRGRIIAAGFLAALAALAATLLVGIVDGQTLPFILRQHALWAALSTLGAAFVVEGLLPWVERLFSVTTNMTLLEWCDPNKPLLRMLAAESPGTYNHSLLVGVLADGAADAIGANGLLARAGAYYHDIGKINKPEYFVENQGMGVGNRHERLSPAMSHLIIIGHVKDGIEMAKAYGLPTALHAFIPEHHGTCVIEYFYHAASQARKPGDAEVSDTQFRYPGPKPQSRETAIVMMCDSVEGAVRAMAEPTPNRIEDTVERIIQKRLADGQFDECDLTFRELADIRASLVKSLISLYHGRIKYPSAEEEKPKDAKPTEARSAS